MDALGKVSSPVWLRIERDSNAWSSMSIDMTQQEEKMVNHQTRVMFEELKAT